jgi:hypothetical protein
MVLRPRRSPSPRKRRAGLWTGKRLPLFAGRAHPKPLAWRRGSARRSVTRTDFRSFGCALWISCGGLSWGLEPVWPSEQGSSGVQQPIGQVLRRIGCACGVVVLALALTSPAFADITVQEGQSFSGEVVNIGGCALSSASINWGDGSPNSAGTESGDSVAGTHTYARAGTFNASVSYTCSNSAGTHTASFVATVQDAPLAASGRDVSGTAGQALHALVAHVEDGNPLGTAADLSAQITWGDGSASSGAVTAAPAGGFDVTGDHTYAAAGNYPVATSIADIGGAKATASSTARIAAAAAGPAAASSEGPPPSREGPTPAASPRPLPPPLLPLLISTIALDPASPAGGGVYKRPVRVTVSATDAGGVGVAETRCVLDPPVAPTRFGALPAACPYGGLGAPVSTPGRHVVYAASTDAAGQQEAPVARSFVVAAPRRKVVPPCNASALTRRKRTTPAPDHVRNPLRFSVVQTKIDREPESRHRGRITLQLTSRRAGRFTACGDETAKHAAYGADTTTSAPRQTVSLALDPSATQRRDLDYHRTIQVRVKISLTAPSGVSVSKHLTVGLLLLDTFVIRDPAWGRLDLNRPFINVYLDAGGPGEYRVRAIAYYRNLANVFSSIDRHTTGGTWQPQLEPQAGAFDGFPAYTPIRIGLTVTFTPTGQRPVTKSVNVPWVTPPDQARGGFGYQDYDCTSSGDSSIVFLTLYEPQADTFHDTLSITATASSGGQTVPYASVEVETQQATQVVMTASPEARRLFSIGAPASVTITMHIVFSAFTRRSSGIRHEEVYNFPCPGHIGA